MDVVRAWGGCLAALLSWEEVLCCLPAAAAAGGGGAQQYERRKVALEEREVVLLDASLVCAGRDGVDELWESAHLHGALVAAPGPQWRAGGRRRRR